MPDDMMIDEQNQPIRHTTYLLELNLQRKERDKGKANEEMNVAENVDEAKDDQEMADAEKINAKTPKEED
ncbi:hypothetical protein Tco_0607095 [Tanacetum coccineum]